jgi:hypothetical protein
MLFGKGRPPKPAFDAIVGHVQIEMHNREQHEPLNLVRNLLYRTDLKSTQEIRHLVQCDSHGIYLVVESAGAVCERL